MKNHSQYNSNINLIFGKGRPFVIFLVLLTLNDYTLSGLATSASSRSNKKSVLCSSGLVNLGNTCYLNAQLQCVYHIPYLRNNILHPEKYLLDINSEKRCDESSSSSAGLIALQKVFASMKDASSAQPSKTQRNSALAVSTRPLISTLGINPYEQQDSQEFFKLLLPELSHPPLTNCYIGRYSSYITALDGSNRERTRIETFLDLSLDVTYRGVREALTDGMFTSAEVLSVEEGNGWRPPNGEEKVDALKGMALGVNGLPSVLQLHLKRFDYDWETGGMSKVNARFTFPKELDLSNVCKDAEGADASSLIYELQSVVVHVGDHQGGHYYSYVRPDIRRNLWFRYDDERVTQVTFKEVKEDSFGGRKNKANKEKHERIGIWGKLRKLASGGDGDLGFGWGGKSSSAYMIQYVRRSDIPMLYND